MRNVRSGGGTRLRGAMSLSLACCPDAEKTSARACAWTSRWLWDLELVHYSLPRRRRHTTDDGGGGGDDAVDGGDVGLPALGGVVRADGDGGDPDCHSQRAVSEAAARAGSGCRRRCPANDERRTHLTEVAGAGDESGSTGNADLSHAAEATDRGFWECCLQGREGQYACHCLHGAEGCRGTGLKWRWSTAKHVTSELPVAAVSRRASRSCGRRRRWWK